jgi:integrase
MHRDSNRLNALKVARVSKPGRYGDGGGLLLQVSKWGTKAWLFRFERDGRERQMGLGPVADVSLAEARQSASNARKQLRDGIDPITARKEARGRARAESQRALTFKQCAEKYIAAHEASWRNAKHRAQWKSTLDRFAYPIVGSLPVAAVDTALVVKVIEPIWAGRTETATRLRGRIEVILDWARVAGYREGENPARWRGHLDKLLPARGKVRSVQHHAALPYSELPAFMAELRERDGISARALEWTILTAVRTGEALGARWSEIDHDTWTVPRNRMKGGRDHRVPLPARVLEILSSVPRESGSDFIFAGARQGAPLSNMAMIELLRGMRPGLTVHGMRSSFRDWAAEKTNYPNHVVEMALAHVVGDKVEAAYRRGDLFDKRRKLMEAWAEYCGRMQAGKVVPIRRVARPQ